MTQKTAGNLEHSGQKLSVKMAEEEGVFEGYGSVFGVVDLYGDVVMPGAFSNTLQEHKEAGTLPAMLWQHDPGRPIGAYTDMKEDDKGLFVRGKLALDTQLGREAHVLLKQGALKGLSIGFLTKDSGRDDETGNRLVNEIELWECSVVTFAANTSAQIDGVKSVDRIEELKSIKEIEKHLRDEGGYSKRAACAMLARHRDLVLNARDAGRSRVDLAASQRRMKALLST